MSGPPKASTGSVAGWRRASPAAWRTRRTLIYCGWRPPPRTWSTAREFAEAIRSEYPEKLLAYNCSPSFHWRRHLDEDAIAKFQRELGQMGYAFQFITLAGFHSLNHAMFTLARDYAETGMSAYVALQQAEFEAEAVGYTATRHQREVGTGYYDLIATAVTPSAATVALAGSTEQAQFH